MKKVASERIRENWKRIEENKKPLEEDRSIDRSIYGLRVSGYRKTGYPGDRCLERWGDGRQEDARLSGEKKRKNRRG